MVVDEVRWTSTTIILVITLFMSKTFIFKHLFSNDGEGHVELLKGEKYYLTMLKFSLLCSPNDTLPSSLLDSR
jgi:hypothetical protein